MIIENDIKLDFKDVLIRPRRSSVKSRSDVDLNCTITFKHVNDYVWQGVPIMVSNMDTTGTFNMVTSAYQNNMFVCVHKHYSLVEWIRFRDNNCNDDIYNHFAISCGSKKEDLEKINRIINDVPKIRFICLDVANGYTTEFEEFVKVVRSLYPNKVIIAGSVVTREMTEQLILAGADIVKVGIGSGSVCTTRKKTGVGYPQLSCLIECADAAHSLGAHIVSDGGCTCPGDFSKAFGGGADFVMSGGMFAGHTESGGNIVEKDGEKYVEFYGMSSSTAMDKYSGGVANYRTSEGKKVLLKYKGDVLNTIQDIFGGIRSTCTYIGVRNLQNISYNTTFIRVTQQLNEIYS